jgi:cytochrome c oxidase subunit 1
VDMQIHDTYFIVAHLHYVLFGGSLFGVFAAINYWYPKMFGRMMNQTLNTVHALLSFVFFNLTFFPMHILGMGGHMRRIYDPTLYEFLKPLQPMNQFISINAFLLGATQVLFAANFIYSLFAGKKAERNPWHANSLEWATSSPAPHLNWGEKLPTVYRGPYEFSSPEVAEDYLPQDRPLTTTPAPSRTTPSPARA